MELVSITHSEDHGIQQAVPPTSQPRASASTHASSGNARPVSSATTSTEFQVLDADGQVAIRCTAGGYVYKTGLKDCIGQAMRSIFFLGDER